MTLKRYYLRLDIGYVLANSKKELFEILEDEHPEYCCIGEFPAFYINPHKDYKISKVSKKITQKDLKEWDEQEEIRDEVYRDIEEEHKRRNRNLHNSFLKPYEVEESK